VCGGILTEGAAKADESPTGEDVGVASKEGVGDVTRKEKRKRVSKDTADLPLGVYEPHGGIVHCKFCLDLRHQTSECSLCGILLLQIARTHSQLGVVGK
jgi:hypothetical protein